MDELAHLADLLQPHLLAVALISARLVPIAFLCPLLGGAQAPVHVKLGTVLALAFSLHAAAGVGPAQLDTSGLAFAGAATRELMFGFTLGLIASLPFDAARLGGRFIDLFRGSSAEATLPLVGSRESACGEVLSHLLLALGATSVGLPLLLAALWRSFALVPLGAFTPTQPVITTVVSLVGSAMATGLAIGAPIAGLCLAIDVGLGLASRAAPHLNLQETGAPLRIIAGASLLWLAIGVVAARLQAVLNHLPDAVAAVVSGT